MGAVTRCTHSTLNHFLNPFCPNQSLTARVAKVFFYGLGVVILWYCSRPKGTQQSPPLDNQIESKESLNATSLDNNEKATEGRIWIYLRTTGSVGLDQKYRFGETLQLQNGNPLEVARTDLYVHTMIQYKGKSEIIQDELPSSLFVQARQGDQICFRRNGELYRLTLTPLQGREEVPFDDCFECVGAEWKYSKAEFQYEEDIPEDYLQWSQAGAAPVFLSPETKRIIVGQRGLHPVDFDELEAVSAYVPQVQVLPADKFKDQNIFRFIFAACGRPRIDILVDRHHLYIRTVSEIQLKKNEVLLSGSTRTEYLFRTTCVDETSDPDYANAFASLDDTGRLTLDIPLLPKASPNSSMSGNQATEAKKK